MSDNPLLPLVLQVLRAAPAGISEYALLKRIEATEAGFGAVAGDANLVLFQKHFLLMNALYRLQQTLWRDEGVWLHISPLHIALERRDTSCERALAADSDAALRDYYLDWQQLEATDSAAVAALLADFWRRLQAQDGRAAALAALDLDNGAEWPEIKRQYRRLAAATHPDRGGDGERFLAVRAAYELLSALRMTG